MEIYIAIFLISSSIAVLAIAGAVWYIAIKTATALDRIVIQMSNITQIADETSKNINNVVKRVDGTLNAVENVLQGITFLRFLLRGLSFTSILTNALKGFLRRKKGK